MPPIEKLTKEQILAALARLNEKGVTGEICNFGGAAMVLALDARESTRDVDGMFVSKKDACESARQVAEEPALLSPSLEDGGYADAFVASTAAYLGQAHNLEAPPWINSSCRRMPVPYFAAKSRNMKAILLQESPSAFRVRNLFVSANALHRA